MLQSGEAAVGIGMACMFERAWAGTAEYTGNAQSDIMQVLGMYDNIYGILTLDSSPYYAVEDITEKTVVASTATNLTTIKQPPAPLIRRKWTTVLCPTRRPLRRWATATPT